MTVVAPQSTERRLVLVIGAIVFVDTMFYAAIAPLLPTLAHQLHLSKLSAGVITAAYPLGTLLGSIPGGILAARAGPKTAVTAGLGLLAGSTLAFGLLHNELLLDLARFVEGVGGACSWAGGIAWIAAETPAGRRGARMGSALSAAVGGALFGPLIGTVATAVGRGPAFSGVVIVASVLIVVARRLPSHHVPSAQGIEHVRVALRSPTIAIAMWLTTLPAVTAGAINVLAPLRIHALGGSAAAIGAAFLVAAALEAVVSPIVGRISDRRGRLLPMRFGLLSAAVLLLGFTVPSTPVALGALVVALAASLGAFWAPAMAMLADAAEQRGLDQGLAAALMNLAWAGGQIIGSGAGGAVAKAAGDGVPATIVAGICVLTLVALPRSSRTLTSARRRRRPLRFRP
jgi:MFS family permease